MSYRLRNGIACFHRLWMKVATMLVCLALAISCLDWYVDYFYGLRETICVARHFECVGSLDVSCLFFLGLIDFMECLINESGNTYV